MISSTPGRSPNVQQAIFNACAVIREGAYFYSLQWDCGLVSRIESQGSVAMTHGRPHMECVRTVVIAGDTCYNGAIYMSILHQAMTLHSFSSLLEP